MSLGTVEKTFLAASAARLETIAGTIGTGDIALFGAAHGTPYVPGLASPSAKSPAALRNASVGPYPWIEGHDFDFGGLLLNGRRLVDCGDVPTDPHDPAGNRRGITEAARAILGAGGIPVLLGGDDSVPIPFFAAFEGHGPLTLLQIDAHIDWRHERDGETQGFSSPMRRASEMAWFTGMVQVGMRGVGSARPAEFSDATRWGSRIVTAREVHREGIDTVLEKIPAGTACLVTIDFDAVDPAILPAVCAPAPGGLTFHQVLDLLHGLAGKTRLAGASLVELAPDKDPSGLSAATAARIVANVIGAIARSG